MSESKQHILVNALSVGSGGGYTVARELCRHLALARRHWKLTLTAIKNDPLHRRFSEDALPDNCQVLWAPEQTSKWLQRKRYETKILPQWAREHQVTGNLQLNGMVIPDLGVPTLSHHQDPLPYRPEAWKGSRDRFTAIFKRRAISRSLRDAEVCGWTSHYLEDLICSHSSETPRHSEVFYNGVPESWLARASTSMPPWTTRPLEIATVSNVFHYKQQSLVIRALPRLHAISGLEGLNYHAVGQCTPAYKRELEQLAKSLGVERHVFIEGRVPDERVEEVLTRARAMVLMSLCESFGIPMLEAMTFGTPVVAADCCALPEVAGDAAELVKMDDLEQLVDAIAGVLTNPSRAEDLRQKGALQVQKFSWASTAARMADCFDELIN